MTTAQSSRRIEYVPLDTVCGANRNPKNHDIAGIRKSIGRFGLVAPAVIDERTGRLVAGHGRTEALRAMRDAGEFPPAGVVVDEAGAWTVPQLTGWSSHSDAEADAYVVADNEWTIRGGWDSTELADILGGLAAVDLDLLGATGFTEADLAALVSGTGGLHTVTGDPEANDADGTGTAGDGSADIPSTGSLLAIADVSVAEPAHQTTTGDQWLLGERHRLVVADVMSGWPQWSPLLVEGALFVPYPGPYAPLALKADEYSLVMVQPDVYIAGHILDKYEAVRGAGSAVKVGGL